MTHPNDPAFLPEPRTIMRFATLDLDKDVDVQEGLTKREWFAGLAMIARSLTPNSRLISDYTKEAIEMADALIKELSK